ncbi:MAG: HAMP domain-containing protein, partial [Bacteroidota bacterium]
MRGHRGPLAPEERQFDAWAFAHDGTVYEVGWRHRQYRERLHEDGVPLAWIMLGLSGLVLLGYPVLFRGSVLRPMRQLRDGLAKVESGDLSARVPVGVPDEIGGLSVSFNHMAEGLETSRQRLDEATQDLARSEATFRALFVESFNAVVVTEASGEILEANRAFETLVGMRRGALQGRPLASLFVDVTPEALADAPGGGVGHPARMRAAGGEDVGVLATATRRDDGRLQVIVKDLSDRDRAERLTERDRARSALLAHVADELRAPLALLLGPLHRAVEGAYGRLPGLLKEHLRETVSHGQDVGTLVDRILHLSRLSTGQIRPEVRPVAVGPLVRRVARASGTETGADVTIRDLAPESVVRADPFHLEAAVRLLVADARVPGLPLVISVETDGAEIAVSMAGHASGDSAAPTPSVAAALARDLVELQGGSFAPAASGGGTVRLLRSVAPEASAGDGSETPEAPTVVLVNDHPDLRRYVRDLAAPLGEVAEAATVEAALTLAREARPSLVVVDDLVPEAETLIRSLRADPATESLGVLILASRPGSVAEALASGADDALEKPFDARVFRARAAAL